MKISAIVVGERSRMTPTKVEQLAASIERVGLIQPPVVREVNGEWILVSGGRRLAAMLHLGWTETRVTIAHDLDDELQALLAEGEENTEREPFTPLEAVAHRRRIREVEERLANERQREAGEQHGRGQKACSKLEQPIAPPPQSETKTRHRTAKATGYSATTLDKAEQIVRDAEDVALPEPQREAAQAAVTNLAERGAKVEREFRNYQAERAKHDPDLAHAEFRRNLSKVLRDAAHLPKFSPEDVAERANADLSHLIDSTASAIAAWHIEVTAQRSAGLRAITGGKS
jgi:ParB family chromosome partitioning protein